MTPDPAKQAEFHRRRQQMEDAIYKEMAACMPGDWSIGTLELNVETTEPGRGFTMNHKLRNPASRQGIGTLPHSLLEAVGRMHVLFHDHHQPWNAATFAIVFQRPAPGQPRRLYCAEAHYEYATPPPAQGGISLTGMN